MLTISDDDIAARLRADNPWWQAPPDLSRPPYGLPRRDYFSPFARLVQSPVQRAVILLGARRVGKTTMLHQLIGELIHGRAFSAILFASIDTPTYSDLSLDHLLALFLKAHPHDPGAHRLVVLDEIQYLRDWERHLKVLVDNWPETRFVASGSAGATLRHRSTESGAGRFTDFELPPLTFAEFLSFRGLEPLIESASGTGPADAFRAHDIAALNNAFVDYVNFGGYPEAVAGPPEVQADFQRFVGRDIVDKVLLRDLPSLYGIQDIQELNRLFQVLAYNTGQEVSLEALSQNSGVAKNTIQRYLRYFETAFLIHRVLRVDDTARRFQRQRAFKVYLTNPSMRAALFGPMNEDSARFGALAETAVFAQYQSSGAARSLYYAHWPEGEVDVVLLEPTSLRPIWAYDVKWSDHHATRPEELRPLIDFAARTGLRAVGATTKTVSRKVETTGLFGPTGPEIHLFPTAVHCHALGYRNARAPESLERFTDPEESPDEPF
ncbi:MAG: ATP-binding protein [Rhodospirillales bacterium]|nr:ATP-binding protein [Rhodospirillales bacterium]